MITKAEKSRQINVLIDSKINTYHLEQFATDIHKASDEIKVLHKLLIQEVNKHNAAINRKITALEKTGAK